MITLLERLIVTTNKFVIPFFFQALSVVSFDRRWQVPQLPATWFRRTMEETEMLTWSTATVARERFVVDLMFENKSVTTTHVEAFERCFFYIN
jgi:hypothetical protein